MLMVLTNKVGQYIMSISDFQVVGIALLTTSMASHGDIQGCDVENNLFPVSSGDTPLAQLLLVGGWGEGKLPYRVL